MEDNAPYEIPGGHGPDHSVAQLSAVESLYPKGSAAGGRPPIPLERMLRIYFLPLWFNISDGAVEEALCDSEAMRRFVGIDLGLVAAPEIRVMERLIDLFGKPRALRLDNGPELT